MSKSKLAAGLLAGLNEREPTGAGAPVGIVTHKRGRPPEGPDGTAKSRNRAVTADGKQRAAIIAYGSPGIRKWLKSLVATEDTTVNALMLEAVDLLRRARGEHPFGER